MMLASTTAVSLVHKAQTGALPQDIYTPPRALPHPLCASFEVPIPTRQLIQASCGHGAVLQCREDVCSMY